MRISLVLSLFLSLVVIAGCGSQKGPNYTTHKVPSYADARNNQFIPTNHRAAEALLSQLQGRSTGNTFLIATLVNIDALERSSTLGRLVSEQVAARFTQAGYHMVEMKFSNSIYISRSQGELMLTREIQELASEHSAGAVIVGTYGESRDFVYINLKVIEPGTNFVIAVHDYALPIDENIRAMLRQKRS